MEAFIVARNPEAESWLPFLIFLPLDRGAWFKAGARWPSSSRVYCHPVEGLDAETLDILEHVPVVTCERRGAVVDLVLERAKNRRAQFVFRQERGRPKLFWLIPNATGSNRSGFRLLPGAARRLERITIDPRERSGYTFEGRGTAIESRPLRVGSYAAVVDGTSIAIVERKVMSDFCKSLLDGSLASTMAGLALIGPAAIVVEGTYAQLLRRDFASGDRFGDLLCRLQVRFPSVPVVFAETGTLGERWTYAFFAAAAERLETSRALAAIPDGLTLRHRKRKIQ